MKINPKLKDFFTTGRQRIRVLYGGRSSSKSHSIARQVLVWAMENDRMRIVIIRQYQNKIQESFFKILEEVIYTEGLDDEFEITKTGITCKTTGSSFTFFGIALQLQEIKGLENVNVVILEEMTGLTKAQWDILYPTFIRVKNNVIFLLFNPGFYSDFSYQNFIVNPMANSVIHKINYDDNPYLTRETLEAIEEEKIRDHDNYMHIYEGVPKDSNERSVFQRKWILAAIDYPIKATGEKILGVDPSGEGVDLWAVTARRGVVVRGLRTWKSKDTGIESAHKVLGLANGANIDAINYDSGGGYGGVLDSEITRLSKIPIKGVSFSQEVPDTPYIDSHRFGTVQLTSKQIFGSYKAMMFWQLADRFRKVYEMVQGVADYPVDQLISIQVKDKSLINQLVDELMLIETKPDYENKIQLESKKDLRARANKSPDLADSLVVCFEPPKKVPDFYYGKQ